MSDRAPMDLESVVAYVVLLTFGLRCVIHLVPLLAAVLWRLVPRVILFWFIGAVLRSMIHKLLD
jgi:hypothetical protein